MNRYKSGESQEQISLMPMCYDDMIDEANPVRAIDAIVENMDTLSLGFQYSQTATDFKTIADFRRNNKKAIKRAFIRFSLLCDSLGLIGKEIIAMDGSKFRANNSTDNYCTARKTLKKIEYYE